MEPPLVTVILPTRGERASLADSLRSLFAQTRAGIEILVVDDAEESSRWTEEPRWAELLAEPRVRIVRFRQGRGCAAAKNAGLREALGAWVCYLDDDNAYLPTKVEAQLRLAEREQADVVLCGLEMRVGSRRRLRQVEETVYEGDALLLRAWADTNVLFHRRDAGVSWDEDVGTVDDFCFFQSLLESRGIRRVPNVPEPLVAYRVHPGERANTDYRRFYTGVRRMAARHLRAYSRPARRLWLRRQCVALCKYPEQSLLNLLAASLGLWREGGAGELRHIANALAVRTPLLRSRVLR